MRMPQGRSGLALSGIGGPLEQAWPLTWPLAALRSTQQMHLQGSRRHPEGNTIQETSSFVLVSLLITAKSLATYVVLQVSVTMTPPCLDQVREV
jgi:hypothetical protein